MSDRKDNTNRGSVVVADSGWSPASLAIVVAVVDVIARLPALGAWWHGADWSLLAGASPVTIPAASPGDLVPRSGLWPLGEALYWRLLYPLWALDPAPYTWTRLGLHGLVAFLTTRIASRCGLPPLAALVAGLAVAIAPVSFTPLYQAGGVGTLLAMAAALAASALWQGQNGQGRDGHERGRRAYLLTPLLAGIALLMERPGRIHLAYALAPVVALLLCALLAQLWRYRRAAPAAGVSRPAERAASMLSPQTPVILLLAILAAAGGYVAMQVRLQARTGDGIPADSHVLATAISFESCRRLDALPQGLLAPMATPATAPAPVPATAPTPVPTPAGADSGRVILLQAPETRDQLTMTEHLGDIWVTDSPVHRALGGHLGPRLYLPPTVAVSWASGLRSAPAEAYVLADTGLRLQPWGRVPQALLYLALTEIGRDQFLRAHQHLLRAGLLHGASISFAYDPDLLPVTAATVAARQHAFIDYLAANYRAGRSRHEVAGLQSLFLELLSTITGQSRAQLEAGATLLPD